MNQLEWKSVKSDRNFLEKKTRIERQGNAREAKETDGIGWWERPSFNHVRPWRRICRSALPASGCAFDEASLDCRSICIGPVGNRKSRKKGKKLRRRRGGGRRRYQRRDGSAPMKLWPFQCTISFLSSSVSLSLSRWLSLPALRRRRAIGFLGPVFFSSALPRCSSPVGIKRAGVLHHQYFIGLGLGRRRPGSTPKIWRWWWLGEANEWINDWCSADGRRNAVAVQRERNDTLRSKERPGLCSPFRGFHQVLLGFTSSYTALMTSYRYISFYWVWTCIKT